MINDNDSEKKVKNKASNVLSMTNNTHSDNEVSILIQSMKNKINTLENKINELEEQIKLEKLEKLQAYKKLYDEYSNIEYLLIENKNLKDRYTALVNSKLGKLTLKYWKFINRSRSRR